MDKLVRAIFAVVGILALTGAFYAIQETRRFIAQSETATGVVVENVFRDNPSKRATGSYYPRVRFATRDGEEREFLSDSGSPRPEYQKNERVEVLYEPKNPARASIKDFGSLWAGALGLLGLGCVALGIGIVPLILKCCRAKKPSGSSETRHAMEHHVSG